MRGSNCGVNSFEIGADGPSNEAGLRKLVAQLLKRLERQRHLSRTLVVTSLIAFISPVSLLARDISDPTSPAKVLKVRKNKRGPYVVFDQGSATGFVVGRDVCFYDDVNQRLGCGTVIRTKPRAAGVYVTDESAAKLKSGNVVWPEDLGTPKISPVGTDDQADSESDALALLQEDDPPELILPPLLARRLQFHISPTYALPVWLNDLRFNAGARAAGSGDIWVPGDTIKGSVVGFGARYFWPQYGRGDMSLDFTYHFVPQRPVKDDFDVTNASVAVLSKVWSHHYRLRWMRGATWLHGDQTDLLLYTGFGYDFMRAKFKSEKVGAISGALVEGSIQAHALELPLIVTWQRHFGSWMISVGADGSLPLFLFGVDSDGKLSYDEATAAADKSFGGAVEAVNVRRGWFALALQFGLGAVF